MTPTSNKPKKRLLIITIILTIGSLSYRAIYYENLQTTSLLFVGIPTLLTLMVINYASTPKTVYGMAFRVITLFLLMSSILLGEGTLCVIMAAPIFYGVTFLTVLIINLIKKRRQNKLYSFAILPLIILLAQPYQYVKTPKIHQIQTSKLIQHHVSISDLNASPDFMKDYPSVFKIGFPKPVSIEGYGIEVGDERKIQFLSSTKGIGTLHLMIDSVSNSKISFDVVSDDTHISHWLSWKNIEVEINAKEEFTEVIWTSNYTCDLGPKWYFSPIEDFVVNIMNEHLIHSYFDGNRNN
ncbi:hypothetical protein KMW28_22790 [Flammeovirga yaeyamensis]|uniref:Polyketide cyclase/dehydrase n=1 Tax=Flammeovirga yaeyamensis TaxID=367791 RepID=A0AAX1NCJ2_9BACT|nr:hypothetical protein [Flammeovirga yaeyamensis]MBB3696810.1 hypothetical protein [Flammeovirga yaeyamensis]NMF33475.1 hypothetical protein [Flammeovirga yaeyamensis]QWG05251.1 hypothetical protein KMW28_22790 [Flammeovirga yaeyamensis]